MSPSSETSASPSTSALVVCLCADWCGSCREYQSRFEQAAAMFPSARFVWIDIEDEADLVDPIEVENFPTLLVAHEGRATFFGAIMPQAETLERLVRAQLETGADAPAPLADANLHALAQRLAQYQG